MTQRFNDMDTLDMNDYADLIAHFFPLAQERLRFAVKIPPA
jgi:hypothetical protein